MQQAEDNKQSVSVVGKCDECPDEWPDEWPNEWTNNLTISDDDEWPDECPANVLTNVDKWPTNVLTNVPSDDDGLENVLTNGMS